MDILSPVRLAPPFSQPSDAAAAVNDDSKRGRATHLRPKLRL